MSRTFTNHRWAMPLLGALALAAMATALFKLTALGDLLSIDLLSIDRADDLVRVVHDNPESALLVPPLFLLAALAFIPTTALIATIAFVFAPLPALAIAFTSALASASALYAIGRRMGPRITPSRRNTPDSRMNQRLAAFTLLFRTHAFAAIVVARILPFNFSAVSHVGGALSIPFRAFFLGSLIGIIPEVAILTALVVQLQRVLAQPSWTGFLALGASLVLLAFIVVWIVRRVDRALLGEDEPIVSALGDARISRNVATIRVVHIEAHEHKRTV